MKFKYTGDPNQPTESKNLPETFSAFGVTFDRNKFAEVPDDVARKLATNPHFKAQGDGEIEADDQPSEETKDAIANIQAEAYQKGYADAEMAAQDQIQRMQNDHADALALERDRADAAEQLLAEQATEDKPSDEPAKRGPGRPKAN